MNQHVLFLGSGLCFLGCVMPLATTANPKARDGAPVGGGCRVHTQSGQFGAWGTHG